MDTRKLCIILGLLSVIAIVWRVADPPAPTPPGPAGIFPSWKSYSALGEMSSCAVNPAGTMWAGVWNQKTKASVSRSAVWIIDFAKDEAKSCVLKDGVQVSDLGWSDDKTIRLSVSEKKPSVMYVDVENAKVTRTVPIAASAYYWPAKMDKFVAREMKTGDNIELCIMSESGDMVGKEVDYNLSKNAALYDDAALSKDANLMVFSILDESANGGRSYFLADTRTGIAKRAFDLNDLPGKPEGIWVSQKGILVVCSELDKFECLVFDPKTNKLVKADGVNLKTDWPDAPENMMFTTYNGGYNYDLASGKTKRLFSFKKMSKDDDYIRQDIRDGRLYPHGDGYISISKASNTIDIRELKKDGTIAKDILKRR